MHNVLTLEETQATGHIFGSLSDEFTLIKAFQCILFIHKTQKFLKAMHFLIDVISYQMAKNQNIQNALNETTFSG